MMEVTDLILVLITLTLIQGFSLVFNVYNRIHRHFTRKKFYKELDAEEDEEKELIKIIVEDSPEKLETSIQTFADNPLVTYYSICGISTAKKGQVTEYSVLIRYHLKEKDVQ